MEYKFLKHTADIAFQAYGKTLNSSFENSAIAMFKAMYPKNIDAKIKKTIKIKGRDLESLLYNFLQELLFLLDSKGFFLSKVKVEVNEKNLILKAIVWGDTASKYPISLQVKAVTYNNMIIKKIKDKWTCQVVLDV